MQVCRFWPASCLPRLWVAAWLCAAGLPVSAVGEDERAEWVWEDREGGEPAGVVLAHTFGLDGRPSRATLRVQGDFCSLQVRLNEEAAGAIAAYGAPLEVDVSRFVRDGINLIEISATGTGGPAAVVARIEGELEDGTAWSVRTGPHWKVGRQNEDERRPARSYGPLAALAWPETIRRPDVGAFDEYNQWKEALGSPGAATFTRLPEGFEVACLRTARDDEGSWVSMAIDPRGRIVLGREDRGLLRIGLDHAGKPTGEMERIDDSLKECRGLLFAHGSLYANANNSKGLYRLRDVDGDDRFEEVTLLRETGGRVGHGRNDLALGPDGMIYAIHGDSVEVAADLDSRLPPAAEPRRHEGHLLRTDPDGKRWEVVCSGLRNPFGIDFHPDGELFTYDADNESDMGLPFYRPTRVNHLVSGADYGWRQGGGSWPVHAPESLPTTLDIGHGSPTAVKFGTRSRFPPPYREALFVLDWAYGRIVAVHATARGASYACRAQTFLRGRPLNVTDLEFGPDGAMYFITGGRKTRSALYRIRYTGPEVAARGPTGQEQARRHYSRGARDRRRQLERWHQPVEDAAIIDRIWPDLANPDPWLRHAARVALEHQPPDRWRERALAADGPGAPAALLALARVAGRADYPAVARALGRLTLGTRPRHQRLAVLRAYELCLSPEAALYAGFREAVTRQLEPHLATAGPEERREIAGILVGLHSPAAITHCLDLLARARGQAGQLYYLDLLSRAEGVGWTVSQREAFWRALQQARTFDGDRSLPVFLRGIRERALAGLSDEGRRVLSGLIDGDDPATAAAPLPPRPVVRRWTVNEIMDLLGDQSAAPAANYKRGLEMFTEAQCVRCHQVGAHGVPVGPNLTAVASRFGREDLLMSILEPSKVVAEAFRNHVIVKAGSSGETVVGRVIRNDFRRSVLVVGPDPYAPWRTIEVAKEEIARHEISPVSPMPAGLLDRFTVGEIRELLVFLESGGDRGHPLYMAGPERGR